MEKEHNQFYICHKYKKPKDLVAPTEVPAYVEDVALNISSFAPLIVEENEANIELSEDMQCKMEELIDMLNSMSMEQFKLSYPHIYKKYYEDKLIDYEHISISYYHGFVSPIEKIYVSEIGFSIANIAEIIRKQFHKYDSEYHKAKNEGRTPKYLIKPIGKYWNVRFDILYKPLGMDNMCYSCNPKCGVCAARKIPHVVVRVDT